MILFFMLTPGILFCFSKRNKIATALIHGIIFSILFIYFIDMFLECLDENQNENPDLYSDPSCNLIIKETDSNAESESNDNGGIYFIDGSNCVGPQTFQ